MAEEFLPKPQTDLPAPELEIPAHAQSESGGNKKSIVLKPFVLGFIFIVILALIAGAYLIGRNNSNQQIAQTQISSPSPTPDLLSDWETYEGKGFTFKYPSTWQIKTGNKPIVYVYDPNSAVEKTGNGGEKYTFYSKYFQVDNIEYGDGGMTPEAASITYENKWKKISPAIDLHSLNTKLNGYDIAIIDAYGEGSSGKNVYIGNTYLTIDTNTSMDSIDSDDVENQILSTFKFTDSNSAVTSGGSAIINAGQ